MQLPFSTEQFLGVFRAYNEAVGIAPALLIALALTAIVVSRGRAPSRHRIVAGVLAVLWLWAGVVYHWGFFTSINPIAKVFGALFVAQALALAYLGVWRGRIIFDPQHAAAEITGWVGIVYALLIYPGLGWAFGHGYPAGPSFGAPCPITIFFFSMMLWTRPPVSWALFIVPFGWAALGMSAAIQLGILEDLAMPALAVVFLLHILSGRSQRRERWSSARAAPSRWSSGS